MCIAGEIGLKKQAIIFRTSESLKYVAFIDKESERSSTQKKLLDKWQKGARNYKDTKKSGTIKSLKFNRRATSYYTARPCNLGPIEVHLFLRTLHTY